MESGGWFNIKTTSYQYRKSHCGDKTILRPSYLHNGISYTGKMTSLYWIRALVWFCIPSICICYATSERETKSEVPATKDMKPTTNHVETVSITNSIFSNIRTWCDGYRRGFENILLRKKLKFNLLTGWAFSDESGLKVSMLTFSMILTNIICNHMTIKCIS